MFEQMHLIYKSKTIENSLRNNSKERYLPPPLLRQLPSRKQRNVIHRRMDRHNHVGIVFLQLRVNLFFVHVVRVQIGEFGVKGVVGDVVEGAPFPGGGGKGFVGVLDGAVEFWVEYADEMNE